MQTIAVLGLGKMGHAIASRLLDTRHQVTVWNRTERKAKDLIEKGAAWAENPAAAALNASIVFSVLADDTASTDAWFGPTGALHSMKPGSFVVECSTISPTQVNKLATLSSEKNLHFIDCPVTGLPEAAEQGRLTLLVGAEQKDLETVRPILEQISSCIRYFGPAGTGNSYKLIINLMGAVQIAALGEGIAMALNLGLDKEAVIDAIENSAAASPQVVRHVRKMAEMNFEPDPTFTTALRYKDADYALQLAATSGSEVPVGTLAAHWFKLASVSAPAKDEAAVVETIISSSKTQERR